MSEAAAAASGSGLVLGRWRPLKPLGSGGSGSVWLALDEKHGLEVALKIIPREGKAASRAEREALAAAQLRHERCLRAYGLARDARHVYIAYEYVPGRTLREALRSGELDDAQSVEAAAQILDALAHAHAHGIVHRDVKPSNVLLAENGGEVSVRLLDFGLARMREAETLTGTGDVPGTLAYIAPERLGGEAGTPASDVWGVGVLLWESLAGFHPFWRGSLLETARVIENGAPALETVRPDLPRQLLAAVDRALALDAARRPSAERLAEALRGAARRRRHGRGRDGTLQQLVTRSGAALASGGLAAAAVGWTVSALPFFPAHWSIGLAVLAAAAAALRPRAGLALTLLVPLFPLGNLSLGLAVLWALFAVVWLAVSWREPRAGLLFALGPVLAPLAALALLPLAAARVRSTALRAAAAAAGVAAAGVVAGVRHAALPFSGAGPAPGLGISGSERPLAVAAALWRVLADHPALGIETVALAAAAAVLPHAPRRGLWGVAVLGAGMLAASVLAAPAVSAVPVVVCVWATCLALAARSGALQFER